MTTRSELLAIVEREVATCPLCAELVANRTQPVFGTGAIAPDVVLIGEAPGQEEDRQGKPFVGRAGRKLDALLSAVGINRTDVYITNIIKCRPPNNREPKAQEIANCRGYLDRQLELLQPKIACAMGSVAAQALCATKENLHKLRDRTHHIGAIPLVCTYHPAYVMRMPSAEPEMKKDLRRIRRRIS